MLDTTRTAAAAPPRRMTAPRALLWPVAALLVVGVAACGDDADGLADVGPAVDQEAELPEVDARHPQAVNEELLVLLERAAHAGEAGAA